MLRHILVSISHSPAGTAEADLAIDIAKRHGGRISGISVVDPDRVTRIGPSPAGMFSYHLRLMETRLKNARNEAAVQAEILRARSEEAGVPYLDLSREGKPDTSLVDAWRFHDIGLVPTRIWNPGEDDLEDVKAVLHLIAMGLRPLIAVPDEAYTHPSKALIALSGSLDSAKAMKQFIMLHPWPDIDLHIVTVGPPKSGERPSELLEEACGYAADHGFTVTTAALPAALDRTQTILDEGDKVGAGVYVMGSSYSKFLTLERYGSHALGMLQSSKVPIFMSH